MIAARRHWMPRSLAHHVRAFCSEPVTPRPLAWFRVGLASVLLATALGQLGHLSDLYGRHGVVDWSVNYENRSPGVPDLAWLDGALHLLGVPMDFGIPLAFAAYVFGLLGLLVGFRSRLAAGLAWFTHVTLVNSGYMSSYGVDTFAKIGLFYCVCFPVGHALSLDRASGRAAEGPSFAAWLGLRVLQLHVCIAYVSSGVEKGLGEQWWNGEAVWRAVMTAPLESPIDVTLLAYVPWLAKLLCWTTLLLETCVVAFVWHPRLRRLWLCGIVGMHLGIAVVLGLWAFSAIMIVFDVAAFGFASAREATTGPTTPILGG